jgi:hypothetical protein
VYSITLEMSIIIAHDYSEILICMNVISFDLAALNEVEFESDDFINEIKNIYFIHYAAKIKQKTYGRSGNDRYDINNFQTSLSLNSRNIEV